MASNLVSVASSEPQPLGIPHPQALSADVYELLIEKLLDPSCTPGSTLNINHLAAAWEVSPTPVREALSRAAATGLVTRRQHYGYRVAPLLPPEDYQALMDVRGLVEPYSAARTAEFATAAELDELEAFQTTMEQTAVGPTAKEYRPYLRADIGFHRGIAIASRNRFIVQAFDGWNIHFFRFQRFRGGEVFDAQQSHVEHHAILDALRKHDPQAAAAAMTTHIEGVRSRG